MPRNFAFSKVNAGRSRKSSKFDLSHSLTSSMKFGDVQPTFCKLMMPDSTLKGTIDTKIRVMPMPLPPFGKAGFHQYGQFVPIAKLWRCFPEFLSGKVYSGSVSRYVPDRVPSLPMFGPFSIMSLLSGSKFSFWSIHTYKTPENPDRIDSSFSYYINPVPLINSGPESGGLYTSNVNDLVGFQVLNFDTSSDTSSVSGFSSLGRIRNGNILNPLDTNTETSASQAYECGINLAPDKADFVLQYSKDQFDAAVPNFSPSSNDQGFDGVVILVRLSAEGRRLVRALTSLGIRPSYSDNSEVNLLPLFAYYKAWFDVFAPQRKLHWSNTIAYELLDYIAESGIILSDNPVVAISGEKDLTIARALSQVFYNISDMWATCDPNYFTTAIRNFNDTAESEVNISSNIEPLDAQGTSPYKNDDAIARIPTGRSGEPAQVYGRSTPLSTSGFNAITRVQMQLVNALTKYINTNTVIGQRLDEFFKAHFNGYTGVNNDSTFAGASVTDIQLGDTIVTASTDDAKAGDFAGVGFGAGDYKINYKAKEFGYFIVFGAVIPVMNYVQGTEYDSYITRQLQFPHPEFDALGYDGVKKSEIFANPGRSGYIPYFGSQIFGYQPRYTGHKVMKSVISGELDFASSRDQWLGFTLDNIMSSGITSVLPETVPADSNWSKKSPRYGYVQISSPNITAGTWWRYLGKYPWLGNQQRIFYDQNLFSTAQQSTPVFNISGSGTGSYWLSSGTAPVSDGFVLYEDQDVTYIAPLNSIGNSYDTIDGDNYVNHE